MDLKNSLDSLIQRGCTVLLCGMLLLIAGQSNAQAFDRNVTIDKVSIMGDPNWNIPGSLPATNGVAGVFASDGTTYTFALSSQANLSFYHTLLSAAASQRQVILHGVTSCGCDCTDALTGVTVN